MVFFSVGAFAADISVRADRNPVNLEDSFQLVFSSDSSPDGDPDFSPLEKDFAIIDQSKNEQYALINGKTSRNVQWTLTLMAKQAGEMTVPPIAFGQDQSAALPVTVKQGSDIPQPQGAGNQDLFLQVEAAPQTPFVQAQIIYTLRLYRRVDIAQASLTEPEAQDALVEKLGEDSNYRTDVNGEPYVVTERKYAIFPQRSGALTIQPVKLEAQVVVGGGSRFGGLFGRQATRVKRVVSDAVKLEVRAAPAEFKGAQWLPAEQLQLQEQWSGPIDSVNSGEPLTRTLTLTVKGATAGELPDLSASMQAVQSAGGQALKAYPDQPAIQERKNPDGIVAVRQEKIALIASQAGEYRLPAIEIPWWNTQTNTLEMARIPEQTIIVAGGGQPATATVPVPTPQATAPAAPPAEPQTLLAAPAGNPFWIGATIFSTLGWLLTWIYFWRKNRTRTLPAPENPETRLGDCVKALQRACQNNDAHAAKQALISWGKQRWGETGLGAIGNRCDATLQEQIQQLNQALYARNAQPWQGADLWQAFKDFEKSSPVKRANAGGGLEPLYKS